MEFENIYEFLKYYSNELVKQGDVVDSTNPKNVESLKSRLIEMPHQFFSINNPRQIILNLPTFRAQPWWLVGEILTEFLALNPPLMAKYRPDIIEQSYKLTPQGTCEYLYGTRWENYSQIENIRKRLLKNPNSKQCIITTYQSYDTNSDKTDVPCNINYMFLGRDNKLDMTATIRSNDMMRGLKYDYPLASFMLQSMAAWTKQDVGKLYFLVNSLHYYKQDESKLTAILKDLDKNKSLPISLDLRVDDDVTSFYKDLRDVKKAEESSYNGNFDYADEIIGSMKYQIFRDFARIFCIKNANYNELPFVESNYKRGLETAEFKDWIK